MNKIVSHTNKYFFIENIHVHFTNKLFLETNKTCTQDDQTSIERKEVGDDMWGPHVSEEGKNWWVGPACQQQKSLHIPL